MSMPEDRLNDDFFDLDPADQLDEYGDPVNPTEPEPATEPTEPVVEPTEPTESVVEPEPEPEPTPEPEPEPAKPTQSAEDNARFAEQRRQRQAEERAQELARQMLQQSPEYQLAQQLQQMAGGADTRQILEYYRQQALEQQAKAQNVPVEVLQRIQMAEQQSMTLQQQLQQMEFNAWYSQQEAAKHEVLRKYPMLNDEDVTNSLSYMLTELGTTRMPLEQAVLAMHGPKITESLREAVRQEVLAEMSGRKPSPLPPQGGRSENNATVLSEDERAMARALGISEKDYAANKL